MTPSIERRRIPLIAVAVATLLAAGLFVRPTGPAGAATVPLDPVVETVLGDETLHLTGFTGTEGLSRLFTYQLDVASTDASISAAELLGTPVTLSIADDAGDRRYFSGLVGGFGHLGTAADGTSSYRLEMVPDLWLLTLSSDHRIFADTSVPDVIAAVLSDFGITDVDFRITQPHPVRECAVQYRETDFAFLSRLMEQEGIFYFFEHGEDGHTLVVADGNHAAAAVDQGAGVPFGKEGGPGTIDEWTRWNRLTPGRYTHTDYDFTRPRTSLLTSADAVFSPADPDTVELYEYPGLYTEIQDGERLARLRMEEAEAAHDVVEGSSTARSFGPGGTFTIGQHPRPDQNGEYLLTSAQYRIAPHEGNGLVYENSFTAIPAAVPFRPPRVTPKPVVHGPQTATVVGPGGEEIYPDEFGRVKVKFHWDRQGTRDETSSCWIRVSQVHAGRGFGGVAIPRIGSEVIVDFLEGDPDRPIIVGRVYNADDLPTRRRGR